MKTSSRFLTAVILLAFLLWLKARWNSIQAQWPEFQQISSYPQQAHAKQEAASNDRHQSPSDKLRAPIRPSVPNRVIVVAKQSDDDTDWLMDELPDWQHAVYTLDDPTTPGFLHLPKSARPLKATAYLTYIIDNYFSLPSTLVFVHPHRSGFPRALHNEFPDHDPPHDIVYALKRLRIDFVQENGYANLRCTHEPGCLDEIRPFREPRDAWRSGAESVYAEAWKTVFNSSKDDEVPWVVGTPCCGQFAVSRRQVWKRGIGEYMWFRKWVMENGLEDEICERVVEYLWHVIFGRRSV
ncbi:hypothetical protein AJ79_01487 [Helicocarpus griseus UAMH5409]|uniref:Uncharacterized protein n=1 Tax=Helicocarpus griseus UAMH5409 TaxID=1447875 RepID=A0A2B7Y726_9EURO|nr:hypothetical protein AJ79_01487 [Helicocarpus griseus UAMH5409]